MDAVEESSTCLECDSDDWTYTDGLQQLAKCNACGREWAVLDAGDVANIEDSARRQ